MLPIHALVMYKTKPATVLASDTDRILIHTIEGEERRVRPKDVALLHQGPIERLPAGQASAEVEDALALLVEEYPDGLSLISWKEFAELAWGDSTAERIVIVWYALSGNPRVELLNEGVRVRGQEEYHKLSEKEEKRQKVAETRDAFIDAFRHAWKAHETSFGDTNPLFQQFFDELGRYARGLSEDSPLAKEIGIKLTSQTVHEALLATGYWKDSFNPWPERNGCTLSSPPAPETMAERPELALERVDLRHLPSYAIDNAWSNDPDDAISIEGEKIWIHVADPASILSPGSRLDNEAMARGSTLYLPEKIIPMLHFSLVQALGLGLDRESKALSFGITLKDDGRIADTEIVPSIVKVERLTYEQADIMLEKNSTLQKLEAYSAIRAALRRRQNAIDIEFPEVAIRANNGDPSFVSVPQTRSARMVQEFMILAGEAVARWAYERGLPFPFATQEPPVSSSLAGCGLGPSESPSENYNRRRVMRATLVSTTCFAHAGLGLSFYSQVTSPLRRYQDLLAHYQIHAFLAGSSRPGDASLPTPKASLLLDTEAMNERLYSYSQQAARNRQAERDSRAHWTLVYLSRHRDWKGRAIVLDASSENAQILIPEFGYETQLRIPRGIKPDETISIALRRASISEQFASFDRIPNFG